MSPPSAPTLCTSCRGRDTTAKKCGSVAVVMVVTALLLSLLLVVLRLVILLARNAARPWLSVAAVLVCTHHRRPVSERSTTISRLSARAAKCGTSTSTGPRKVAGVSCRIRAARPSPSLSGGSVITWQPAHGDTSDI